MSEKRHTRRALQGVVTSTKASQTITVAVERTFKHPRYGKYVRRKKNYAVHDGQEEAQDGDFVEIVATRPLSKTKRWRLAKVVTKSDMTSDRPTAEEEYAAVPGMVKTKPKDEAEAAPEAAGEGEA